MRFVGSPRSNRLAPGPTLLAVGIAGLLLVAPGSMWAADDLSFIYCIDQGGAKIFAGRALASGDLAFGLSVWSRAGQNISVLGIATRRGRTWRYTENLKANAVAERCQLDIERYSDGRLLVMADLKATCQNHGGVNATIGTVRFPSRAFEGPVTTELDDAEAFQRAGRCVGVKK
jgi:hypothetical protein